jgi:hypothetical protein
VLKKGGHQVLIFSQMKMVLDLLENYMKVKSQLLTPILTVSSGLSSGLLVCWSSLPCTRARVHGSVCLAYLSFSRFSLAPHRHVLALSHSCAITTMSASTAASAETSGVFCGFDLPARLFLALSARCAVQWSLSARLFFVPLACRCATHAHASLLTLFADN